VDRADFGRLSAIRKQIDGKWHSQALAAQVASIAVDILSGTPHARPKSCIDGDAKIGFLGSWTVLDTR